MLLNVNRQISIAWLEHSSYNAFVKDNLIDGSRSFGHIVLCV